MQSIKPLLNYMCHSISMTLFHSKFACSHTGPHRLNLDTVPPPSLQSTCSIDHPSSYLSAVTHALCSVPLVVYQTIHIFCYHFFAIQACLYSRLLMLSRCICHGLVIPLCWKFHSDVVWVNIYVSCMSPTHHKEKGRRSKTERTLTSQ